MLHESSWPLIQDAAAGGPDARREFTRKYLPVIRAHLSTRWQGTKQVQEVEAESKPQR